MEASALWKHEACKRSPRGVLVHFLQKEHLNTFVLACLRTLLRQTVQAGGLVESAKLATSGAMPSIAPWKGRHQPGAPQTLGTAK